MPRLTLGLLVAVLLWIAWCMVVVMAIVPALRRHVTMWPWLMSYVLALVPVVAAAMVIVLRLRKVH